MGLFVATARSMMVVVVVVVWIPLRAGAAVRGEVRGDADVRKLLALNLKEREILWYFSQVLCIV